ncbi:hypothetical protein PAXINDRAFT_18639, partial [Paxillus involutus ATCC 200175]
MDVDDGIVIPGPLRAQISPALWEGALLLEFQQTFKLAVELAFSMLSFVLRNPSQKASPFARSTLNPYLPIPHFAD